MATVDGHPAHLVARMRADAGMVVLASGIRDDGARRLTQTLRIDVEGSASRDIHPLVAGERHAVKDDKMGVCLDFGALGQRGILVDDKPHARCRVARE